MSRTIAIQCTNVFKAPDNIRSSFNLLWADIISLALTTDLCYNEAVQSYIHLE